MYDPSMKQKKTRGNESIMEQARHSSMMGKAIPERLVISPFLFWWAIIVSPPEQEKSILKI